MARRRRKTAKWRDTNPPKTLQYEYYRQLMIYTQKVAGAFEKTVFPYVAAMETAALDQEDSMTAAFNAFVRRVSGLSKRQVDAAAVKMVNGVEQFHRKTFVSNIKKSVGVDIESILNKKQVRDDLVKAADDNFRLIRTIDKSYSDRGRAIIQNGIKAGKHPKDIQKDLLDLGGFKNKYAGTEQRRARVIARDQTQKLSKAIDKTRQKKLGVRHFIWVTSADQRVRDQHEKYNNKRFSYDFPPDGELPGDAVQCRCHARPDLEELLTSLENGELQ